MVEEQERTIMTQIRVKELHKEYPTMDLAKKQRRLEQLERMQAFYEDKIEEAPERQAKMFEGFVAALAYAINHIEKYDGLSFELYKLTKEEAGDE